MMVSGENYCYKCGAFYSAWYYNKPICAYYDFENDGACKKKGDDQ